jgi:acyl carrier protein
MKSQPLDADTDAAGARVAENPPAPLCDWIVALFSEKLHVEVASLETDLMQSGALDSLTLVELLLYLEQGLGIKIPLEDLDLDNFRSIARIAEFLGKNGHGNGSPNNPA